MREPTYGRAIQVLLLQTEEEGRADALNPSVRVRHAVMERMPITLYNGLTT